VARTCNYRRGQAHNYYLTSSKVAGAGAGVYLSLAAKRRRLRKKMLLRIRVDGVSEREKETPRINQITAGTHH
jgi:hypothetical protein